MHIFAVVQGYPRRQSCPQPTELVGPLPPEAEGIEQFVVDGLYNLTDTRYAMPQALGPYLASVAFGRADKPRSIALPRAAC